MKANVPTIASTRLDVPPLPWRMSFLGVVLICAGLLTRGSRLDLETLQGLNQLGLGLPTLASSLSVLGLGVSLAVVAGLIGLRRPRAGAAMVVGLIGAGVLVQLVKSLAGTPRPAAVLDASMLQVIGTTMLTRSMPSGHAAAAATLVGLMWLAVPLRQCPAWLRATAPAVGLAGLACVLSRAAVGAHWPSDLLVGVGLGILTAVLVQGTAGGRHAVVRLSALMTSRAGSRVTAALLVACAAALWVAERDYPLAAHLHGLLSLGGLLAAAGWWRVHPGPRRWSPPSRVEGA